MFLKVYNYNYNKRHVNVPGSGGGGMSGGGKLIFSYLVIHIYIDKIKTLLNRAYNR